MPFAPEYVAFVLRENFEDAKTLFLDQLMAMHDAHLVMLADRGILAAADARRLSAALDAIPRDQVRRAVFDGTDEDLFCHVNRLLVEACGEEVAGRLHTARSRNDIDAALYRMRQRDLVLGLLEATLDLRDTLVEAAVRHRDTTFPAHTHTQPAQPSTIAHYLLAVIEQLERDAVRLRAAYESTNHCPLGACAITGTGFDIDRRLTSDLLGFLGPTGNTYGSIATVDYLLQNISAAAVALTGFGRFVQDVLQWCTIEFGYLRLSDGFVQPSSIMPQKRNPVAVEHARSLASRALGESLGVMVAVHNTPFGDIVDTEDDLQPLVFLALHDATRAFGLLAAALRDAEFDRAKLETRASEGGITTTELADVLARDHRLPFQLAHRVVSAFNKTVASAPLRSRAAVLGEVSAAVIGTPIRFSDEALTDLLSPRHFVSVRRTLGGPAADQTSRAIDQARASLGADRRWLSDTRGALSAAADCLHARKAAL
jgi:argininosuccinate lyase